MTDSLPLSVQTAVTLDAAGAGTARLTPSSPKYWQVTEVVLLSDRPGAAPIPRAVAYLDNSLQGLTYDASFNTAKCELDVSHGQTLIFQFTGGQVGDVITVALIGTKSVKAP
jgi:hypothetical protein